MGLNNNKQQEEKYSSVKPALVLTFCHELMGKTLQEMRDLCKKIDEPGMLCRKTLWRDTVEEKDTTFGFEIYIGEVDYLLICELKERGEEDKDYYLDTPYDTNNFYCHRIFLYFRLESQRYFISLLNNKKVYTLQYNRFVPNDPAKKHTMTFAFDIEMPTSPPCLVFDPNRE